MARWIAETGLLPDQILCSSATRTQQTAALVEESAAAAKKLGWQVSEQRVWKKVEKAACLEESEALLRGIRGAELKVYDSQGREVAVLFQGEAQAGGDRRLHRRQPC